MSEERLKDEAFWRARAEQLQTALNSRIVVEQAKGVLRERFGLDMTGAFELMRSAARGKGMNIHLLAGSVTSSFATPDAIVCALARQPEIFTSMSREERVLQTADFFRRLNEAMSARLSGDGQGFLCECANPYCNVTINLSGQDLAMLHSKPSYYAMLPGHQIPELENVIAASDGHIVTEQNLAKVQ